MGTSSESTIFETRSSVSISPSIVPHSQALVASKCGFEVFGSGPRRVTNSASHIESYIEGTIERLGFAPDLYYLHRIDPSRFGDSIIRKADDLQTLRSQNLSLLSTRFARKAKPRTLGCQSVRQPLCDKRIQVCSTIHEGDLLKAFLVAKIDAVQAEYSAFETVHETDGLIEAAKELDIAYVAYSPLGHGWLVDNSEFKSPDDFAPDDFRRTCESFQLCLRLRQLTIHSTKVPGRELLQESGNR